MASSQKHNEDKSDRQKKKKTKIYKNKRSEKHLHNTELVDHVLATSISNSHSRALEKRRINDDTRHNPSKIRKRMHGMELHPSKKDECCARAVCNLTPRSTPQARVSDGRRQKDILNTSVMENRKLVGVIEKFSQSMRPMLDSHLLDRKNWFLDPLHVSCSSTPIHAAPELDTETVPRFITDTKKAVQASEQPKRSLYEPAVPASVLRNVPIPVAATTVFGESERIANMFEKFSQTVLPLLDTNVFHPENWFLDPVRVDRALPSIHTDFEPIIKTLPTAEAPMKLKKFKKDPNELIVDELQEAVPPFFIKADSSQYIPRPNAITPPPSPCPQTLSSYFACSPTPKSKAQTKAKKPLQPKKSSFFPEPFSAYPTPKGLSFELQPRGYGLIQERIRGSLFALVVQTILWNVTTAEAGRPVLFDLLCAYPTPESLAVAQHEDVLNIVHVLGLQHKRTANLIKMAQKWVSLPPDPTRRYYRKDYPFPGSDFGSRHLRTGDLLDPGDDRPGYEIAHLPGIGDYAIDSYRMFYRDTLRGREEGNGFTQEWQKVVPKDKELRKWIIWRWGREGFDYDVVTGNITRFVDSLRFESSELDAPSVRRMRRLSTISVRSGRTFCGP
jgi:methyl-CpG-binding domain protein 4